jgi:hypothetical protein
MDVQAGIELLLLVHSLSFAIGILVAPYQKYISHRLPSVWTDCCLQIEGRDVLMQRSLMYSPSAKAPEKVDKE